MPENARSGIFGRYTPPSFQFAIFFPAIDKEKKSILFPA